MSRLPALSRDKLSAENQAIWDRVMKGRTGGGGPYGILMYAPMMADHFSSAENYFRHDGMLDTKDKELVILAAARELGARFPGAGTRFACARQECVPKRSRLCAPTVRWMN